MTDHARRQKEEESLHYLGNICQYQGKLLRFESYRVKLSDGSIKEYDHIAHPGASVVIAVSEDKRIYLVRQWRRSCQQILYELPAGVLEAKEKIEVCADRELQEEIGKKALRLTSLGSFFTAPGFCNEQLHLFLGEDLITSQLFCDDTMHIDISLFTIEEILEMIDNQTIVDAKTICGIFKYLRYQYHQDQL